MAKVLRYKDNVLRLTLDKAGSNDRIDIQRVSLDTGQKAGNKGKVVLLDKTKTEYFITKTVNEGIATAHKQIAGSIQFATMADFQAAFGQWQSGQGFDITDPDGKVIHYTKADAKIGDIIFVSCSGAEGDEGFFVGEEVVIKNANKDAELFTHNNEELAKFKGIDEYKTKTDAKIQALTNEDIRLNGRIDSNLTKINDRYTKSQVDGKVNGLTSRINTNTQNIAANLLKITQNTNDIATDKGDISGLEERTKAIEAALEALENKWTGDMPLQASADVSQIPGSLGPFSFKLGDKIDIILDKSGTKIPGIITIGDTVDTVFTKGAHKVELKIAVGGTMTAASSTSDQLSSWHVVEAIQRETKGVLNPSYSKSESDARYVNKVAQKGIDDSQDVKIAKNTVDITTKQNATDNSLTTTAKTIPGAINENKANIDTTTEAVNDINELKVSDNRKIQDLNSSVYADQIMIKKSFTQNSHKVLSNNTSANPGAAHIGRGYKGDQTYGFGAEGAQSYGHNATSYIQIGSTKNDAQKANNKLIQGNQSATFEDIIKAVKYMKAKGWI